ncbi:hypothetical protein ACFYT4_14105 [Streptomyces sp. NPDC004609]|uniref:hypothetical protein n=1 Tax=Streptomyces sp. NPDC004609 TaxID=3364704 RepID=UPI0036A66EF5
MKRLLWFLLSVGLAAGICGDLLFEGGTELAVNLSTDIVVIGAAVGLFLMRKKPV